MVAFILCVDAAQLSNSVRLRRGQPSINMMRIGEAGRPEVRSLLGQPSCGKPQLGYRLRRYRFRIPRGHHFVSVVDAPYSDSFEGVIAGDFPPVFFVQSYTYSLIDKY